MWPVHEAQLYNRSASQHTQIPPSKTMCSIFERNACLYTSFTSGFSIKINKCALGRHTHVTHVACIHVSFEYKCRLLSWTGWTRRDTLACHTTNIHSLLWCRKFAHNAPHEIRYDYFTFYFFPFSVPFFFGSFMNFCRVHCHQINFTLKRTRIFAFLFFTVSSSLFRCVSFTRT